MSWAIVKALALNEVRLRMRRLSTVVAVLAVVAISWIMIPDPAGGNALMVSGDARVLYTSSAMALGSAALAALLFGLGGFYLVRGRIAEDIRSGTGSVIGATPIGNALFLGSRWLGGVAYLGLLVIAFMGTMLVCHAVRGEGPIQPLVYLGTYLLLVLPMVFFAVSCAILFDSWAPMMGKGGDVLFFILWMMQLSAMTAFDRAGGLHLVMLFDFSGLSTAVAGAAPYLDPAHLSIGSSPFDAALAPVAMPDWLWSTRIALLRCGAAVVALLPLLPAVLLFHRFSPDKVKVSRSRQRRSPLDVLNGWLRPLSALVRPLFGLAAALPGVWGQVVADVALTLVASPAAIAALMAALVVPAFVDARALGPVLMACAAFWGVLASDVSTRDFQSATEDLTGAVAGGIARRYLRQFAAAGVLGLLFMGVAALRFALHDPVRGAAVVTGIFSLAALASLFGRCSRTSRLFLALFLFGFYVAVNAVTVPMLDVVGFNGAATMQSMLAHLALGAAALAAGYAWNRRQAA